MANSISLGFLVLDGTVQQASVSARRYNTLEFQAPKANSAPVYVGSDSTLNPAAGTALLTADGIPPGGVFVVECPPSVANGLRFSDYYVKGAVADKVLRLALEA